MDELLLRPPVPPRATEPPDAYLERFDRFEREPVEGHRAWLLPLRKAGLARFAELGFPTLAHEDWRYTNIAPIARMPFAPAAMPAVSGEAGEAIRRRVGPGLAGSHLVFVNGHYAPALSAVAPQAGGVLITNLAAALAQNHPVAQRHLARHARVEDNAFTALNTAFFADGALIHVPAGQSVAEPVHLHFVSHGARGGTSAHPRNLIVAERGSQLTVWEHYHSEGEGPFLTNAVTELVAEEGAVVEQGKFQDESRPSFHVAALALRLERQSNVVCHSFALGARLARHGIHTTLAGEGVECVLNGLYLAREEQLVDHHMVVEHAQPRGNSHEYFNGILADRAKGVFHGRILVRPGAQKTDAKQTNRNLLLSDHATVDSKPQLEIYADDVKCTHGATIGQLNEEAVFYLRARGIGEATARRMLIHAFAGEIVERVRAPEVRAWLDRLVWDRLEALGGLAVDR